MELEFHLPVQKHRRMFKLNTRDLTRSFGCRQRCVCFIFFQFRNVLLLWFFTSFSVRTGSPTISHVLQSQDSGIPDSFPVYHYNGLKQSNHNERVRHSFTCMLLIVTDGDSLSPLPACCSSSVPVMTHKLTHTQIGGGRAFQNKKR